MTGQDVNKDIGTVPDGVLTIEQALKIYRECHKGECEGCRLDDKQYTDDVSVCSLFVLIERGLQETICATSPANISVIVH